MAKNLILGAVAILSILATPASALAQNEAGSSAMLQHPYISAPALKIEPAQSSIEVKKRTIKAVVARYGSPLTDADIDEFLKQCTNLEMNCYLLPSIFGVESTFCTAIMAGTYNCAGWGGGTIAFKSFKDGIQQISRGLKDRYVGHGELTVESVGSSYAESKAWPAHVRQFIGVFEAEEKRQTSLNKQLNLASNIVQ